MLERTEAQRSRDGRERVNIVCAMMIRDMGAPAADALEQANALSSASSTISCVSRG
ncbi:hypothetical protein [Bradyrhizobium elkanii]